MNDSLATAVADYLAHKRALGRKFDTEEATLRLLLAFAAQHGVQGLGQLTPALLETFVASRPRTAGPQLQPPRRGRLLLPRLGRRPAAAGCLTAAQDPAARDGCASAVPLRRRPGPPAAGGCRGASRQLQGRSAAAPTYHAIFALCYGLGLRVGEACGLRIGDVDAERQLLTVRGGKFGKSRLVPHGPRIGELLARQVERRRAGREDPLFTFDGRRSVHPCSASQTFHRLVAELAFPVPDGVSPPRLHCLRHSFAVGRLTRWYREDIDPQARLYRLSTFMGHVDPTSTAVYLTITPQLLAEANRRFEAFAEPAWTEDTP